MEEFRGQRLHFADRLINQGYVVLALDAPGHGKRLPENFRGSKDKGLQFEKFMWGFLENSKKGLGLSHLTTLTDLLGFHLLQTHPLVDPNKIGAIGFSYGSIRSYRLAAILQGKLAASVALGAMPRLQDTLIEDKAPYNINHPFFPSQLAFGLDTESLILAAAGTPLMLIAGDNEKYSPGWQTVFDYNREAWTALGFPRKLQLIELDQEGYDRHNWYPVQARDALKFLGAHLRGTSEVLLTPAELEAIVAQECEYLLL